MTNVTISLDSRPTRLERPSLKWRREGDVILMLDDDKGGTYELNVTAAKAWELADGTNTLEGIARQIALEFQADLREVESDLISLFEELERRGYVQVNR